MNKNKVLQSRLTDTQVGVWYLGQESILIKNKNTYIAVDPYLSDYVDRHCADIVPWQRRYAPPIEAGELDFLDAVLCTHAHFDHADPDTLTAIAAASPRTRFVVPAPEVARIAAYGIATERVVPAHADRDIQFGEVTVRPIPAAHEELHRDEAGDYYELGYILSCEAGRFFHAGDMCMYDGLIERLSDIDMAFLPINGRDWFRNKQDIIGNFDVAEAVTLAKMIGAGMLVPLHHDLYAVNGVDPAAFVRAVETIDPYRRYHLFAPGERYIFEKE